MNNIAALLQPVAPAPVAQQVQAQPEQGGRIVSFRHGINIILKRGIYKGRYAIVKEYHPAQYELTVSGTDFVPLSEFDSLNIKPVGQTILTELGESTIRGYFPPSNQAYLPVYMYREPGNVNDIRVGIEATNKDVIYASLVSVYKNKASEFMKNKVNRFVYEIPLVGSLVQQMQGLDLQDTGALMRQMLELQLNNQAPQPLVMLANELRESPNILQKITRSSITQILELEQGSGQPVKMINKNNIIGPKFYINVSDRNFGDIKMYNPNKANYLVDYRRNQYFSASSVFRARETGLPQMERQVKNREDIKNEILYKQNPQMPRPAPLFSGNVRVISGQYRNQEFLFNAFHPAYLTISIDNKPIMSHLVNIFHNNELISKVDSPIYDSDVFYQDIRLTNGNVAEVKRIIDNNNILVFEKDNNQTVRRTINRFTDISSLNHGFKFIEESPVQEEEAAPVEGTPEIVSDEILQEEVADEPQEEREVDYNDELEEGETSDIQIEEQEAPLRSTFRDMERTTFEFRKLTSDEETIKTEILKVLNNFGINEDIINMNDTISKANFVLDRLSAKVNTFRISRGLPALSLKDTTSMKYIIVCVVLYELLRTEYPKNISSAVETLFNENDSGYFKLSDAEPVTLNQNIFIMPGDWHPNVSQSHLVPLRTQIIQNNTPRGTIDIILKNADEIIQSFLNTQFDVKQELKYRPIELIPLGINPVTGRRRREEEEEEQLQRVRTARRRIGISVNDLIDNNIPQNETKILWGTYSNILADMKGELEVHYRNSNNNTYLLIKKLLSRGPYGKQDSSLNTERLKEIYSRYYNILLSRLTTERLNRQQRQVERELQSRYRIGKEKSDFPKLTEEEEKEELARIEQSIKDEERLEKERHKRIEERFRKYLKKKDTEE